MRPTGATTFCAWIAFTTSAGVRLRLVRRWLSNQMRIEYFCWLNSEACPTPLIREISSSTLMVT